MGTITVQQYEKLQEAFDTVCDFCEADECEKCIITKLDEDAYIEVEKTPEKEDE